MARINVEEQWWTDPRRSALIKALGGDEEQADGAVVRLWRIGQEYWKKNHEGIPKHCFETLRYASELLRCHLAIVRESSVFVRGASDHFEWMEKKRLAASAGGKKSAEKRKAMFGTSQPQNRSTTEVTPKCIEASSSFSSSPSSSSSSSESFSLSEEGKNAESPDSPPVANESLWFIYEYHWKAIYKQEPLRNAKVNSQLKQLSDRVPKAELAKLIQFYMRHPKPYYRQTMHGIGALLADCEALVAQMRTGITANGTRPISNSMAIKEHNDRVCAEALAQMEMEKQ